MEDYRQSGTSLCFTPLNRDECITGVPSSQLKHRLSSLIFLLEVLAAMVSVLPLPRDDFQNRGGVETVWVVTHLTDRVGEVILVNGPTESTAHPNLNDCL